MTRVNSDDPQEKMDTNHRKISGLEAENSIERENFNGEISTNIEDLNTENPFDERLDEEYQALDLIYGSLRKTSERSRLEILQSFPETPEEITDQPCEPLYRKAGMINDGELTRRGEKFADEELDWYTYDRIWLDGIDEFYELLTTDGEDKESGSKIQAFEMYGNGENHEQVQSETRLDSDKAKDLANNLDNTGILEQSGNGYRFTKPGNKLENRIHSHLNYLEGEVLSRRFMPNRIETPDSLVDELMDKAYRKASD